MEKKQYPRPHFERDSCFVPDSGQIFCLPARFVRDTVLLNARGSGRVLLNGTAVKAGEGIDVTALVSADGENRIHTEGDFAEVWLESVPRTYIKNVMITPELDEGKVRFEFELSDYAEITVEIFAGGNMAAAGSTRCGSCELMLSELHAWTPQEPFLYEVIFTAGKDVAKGWFALRKLSVIQKNGRSLIALNDQAYFPVGTGCTDIDEAKAAGFDMIITSEKMPAAWYFECDRKGMLVWHTLPEMRLHDFVCAGINTVASADGADTSRLLCCDKGDIRPVGLRCGKENGLAPALLYRKNNEAAFFSRARRMIKKGLAAAVCCGGQLRKDSAASCEALRSAFAEVRAER